MSKNEILNYDEVASELSKIKNEEGYDAVLRHIGLDPESKELNKFLDVGEVGHDTMEDVREYWENAKKLFPEEVHGIERLLSEISDWEDDDIWEYEIWVDNSFEKLFYDCPKLYKIWILGGMI